VRRSVFTARYGLGI